MTGTPHRRGPDHGLEWRVVYRRAGWAPKTKATRRFARRRDLDRFLHRLLGHGRPDLPPLEQLRVTWREVGPWRGDEPDRPRCGQPRSDGRPCRQPVRVPGDTCPWHEGDPT